MPVHNGRKYIPRFASGMVQPRNPIFGVVGKAVIFELLEATSDVRTIAKEADMSIATIRSVIVEADMCAVVVSPVNTVSDIRILAIHPLSVGCNLHLTIYHMLAMYPDIRESVFCQMDKFLDCALVVSHKIMLAEDIKQCIYVYLFRESHEIQI